MNTLKCALRGAILAIGSSLAAGLVFAYLFRIPVPMGGCIGPFGAISPYDKSPLYIVRAVVLAWAFYGVFGGFIILSLSGGVAGAWAGRIYSKSKKKDRILILWSLVAGTIPVFVLSILDWIIGPW